MNRNRQLKNRGAAQPHLPKYVATKPRAVIEAKTKAGTCGGQRINGGCTEQKEAKRNDVSKG